MAAMKKWAEFAKWEYVAFVDADLKFPPDRPYLLYELLKPVLTGKKIMTIAALGANLGNWRRIAPLSSWERALSRELALKIMEWLEENWLGGYGVEIGLTLVISSCFGKNAIKVVNWPGVGQIQKIQKTGFLEGFKGYLRMYLQMVTTWFKLKKILANKQKRKELCKKLGVQKI